ncbi:MAG: hypothetical protein NVS9B6_14460 [Candidatus Limnocylindrales bacterium]
MAWKKAPPELIERFDAAFPKAAGAQRRLMFGFPAGFVNGNLFGGIFEDRVMVRLAGDAVKGLKGARPFEPMPGRTMTGYTELPAPVVASVASLRTWLDRAADATALLPPKAAKTPKRTTATKAKSHKG